MGQGSNIQGINAQPRRWATEGTDPYGREVHIIRDEIPTRIDQATDELIYLGWAEFGEAENEPFWKIRRIQKIGTVWEQRYATDLNGPNQYYRFKWSDRTSLIYL